jgi:hypothetical protein
VIAQSWESEVSYVLYSSAIQIEELSLVSSTVYASTPEDEDKGLDICEQRKNLYTVAAFGNEHAKYIPISRALGTRCIVEPINIYQRVII